jgi:hypothetical protein
LRGLLTPDAPVTVPLSVGAKALWVDFFNDWNKAVNQVSGDLAAAFSKMEAYAARLALIHHVVTKLHDTRPSPINKDSMQAGITLAYWFGGEAYRVYRELQSTSGDGELDEIIALFKKNHNRLTPRELMRARRGRYPTADAAETAIRRLGRQVRSGSVRTGGRASFYFELL